jgi:hypothetical protein
MLVFRKPLILGIMTDSVDDAIEEIFSLSLAKRKNSSDGFWIHSMVHKWSQERLDKVEKGAKASNAVSLTSVAISFGEAREELHYLALERGAYCPMSAYAAIIFAVITI